MIGKRAACLILSAIASFFIYWIIFALMSGIGFIYKADEENIIEIATTVSMYLSGASLAISYLLLELTLPDPDE